MSACAKRSAGSNGHTVTTRARTTRSRSGRRAARNGMPKNRRHATTAARVAPEAPERSPLPEDEEAAPAVEATAALVPVDSLQRYLTDIRRIPVLSREEEHRLALRWHEQGDRKRLGSSSR